MAETPDLVAIINTSEEVVEFLREVLEDEGYAHTAEAVLTFRRGERDIEHFLAKHEPTVVIWDIGFPYEQNWRFFCTLRDRGVFGTRGVVLTTTNKSALADAVGADMVLEIIGKPYDLETILSAVRREQLRRRAR
jgi:DNA-binding response OmpR family regulator